MNLSVSYQVNKPFHMPFLEDAMREAMIGGLRKSHKFPEKKKLANGELQAMVLAALGKTEGWVGVAVVGSAVGRNGAAVASTLSKLATRGEIEREYVRVNSTRRAVFRLSQEGE